MVSYTDKDLEVGLEASVRRFVKYIGVEEMDYSESPSKASESV